MDLYLEEPIKRSLKYVKSGDCFEIWEIDTPEKCKLVWSIMIPYLLSSAEIENFQNSMELLIGDDKEVQRLMNRLKLKKTLNSTDIQNLIRRKNPLVDQQALYNEDDLFNLMRMFKKRLDILTDDLSRTSGKEYNDSLKFQAAANALKRQIDLFDESNMLLESFIPDNLKGELFENEDLILFVRSVSKTNTFRYGVRNNYASYSRNTYLKHILKLAKIPPEKIDSIFNPEPSKQLLLQILQSSEREIVHSIYESAFILEKLSTAGYVMSPDSKDNEGNSAFYHCLKNDDWVTFLKLYNYPTKNVHLNIYDEDHHWKALEVFEAAMTNDYQNLKKNLSRRYQNIRLSYEQILHFISFHKNFLKEKNNIMNDSFTSNSDKIKEVLTLLINEYDRYFYLHRSAKDEFEEYFLYYAYHKILDDYTSLCFTDFFMSLGNIVDVKNESSLEDALLNLLKYFSCKVCFEKLEFRAGNDSLRERTIFFAFFCYRIEWKLSLDALLQTLQSSSVDKDKKNTQHIVETCMKKCPLLKEEYEIMNLKMHFKIAETADFSKDPLKSALIVERALHFIGETICSISDGCMVTPLLRYCLSQDLERAFCDMRNNCFAHYKASSVRGRAAIEKGSDFKDVQQELKTLHAKLNPIFELQSSRVCQDIVAECSKNAPNKLRSLKDKTLVQLMKMEIKILQSRESLYSSYEDKYTHLLYKIFKCTLQELQNKKMSKIKALQMRFKYFSFLFQYYSLKYKPYENFSNFILKVDGILKTGSHSLKDASKILRIFGDMKSAIELFQPSITQDFELKNEFSNLRDLSNKIEKCDNFSLNEQESVKEELLKCLDRSIEPVQKLWIPYAILKGIFKKTERKKMIKIKELEMFNEYFKLLFNYEPKVKHFKFFDILSKLVMQVNTLLKKNTTALDSDISQAMAVKIEDIFKRTDETFDSQLSDITQNLKDENGFSNLNNLFNKIERYEFFTSNEVDKIRGEFEIFLKRPNESRQRLTDHLNNTKPLSAKEIDANVKTLFAPKKLRGKISKNLGADPPKALLMIQEIEDTVETILGKKEETSYKFMKIFLDDMFIRRIKFLNLPLYLHEKIRNLHSQKLDFVIERVQYMKQVLTEDDQQISKWLDKENKTLQEENYTKQLMVQRYVNEIDTKAALESLLLDYLNVINCNQEFDEMKRKSSSLFCGINLRNILSHQCPVVEASNKVLDDKNLANEFINKIYMYLKDLKPLIALLDFYQVLKCPKKKKFEELINDDKTQDVYSHLRETIKSCNRWKRYLFLLPEKS